MAERPGEPLRLVVEGVIGVGKTTLARALAERLGVIRLAEADLENPFLEAFYRQRARHALACQLWFLEARLRQFATLPAGAPAVADHSLAKDPLFAVINLSDDELMLYRRLHARLAPACTFRPSVTIYLTASLTEVRERLRRRDHPGDGDIETGYLQALVQAYESWCQQAGDAGERVVVVSVDGANIARTPAALDHLIEACRQAPPGLSYCHPG